MSDQGGKGTSYKSPNFLNIVGPNKTVFKLSESGKTPE
jgi:hypothetical protein